MKLKHISIIAALLFCATVFCQAGEAVESQIGPFNLTGSPLNESTVVASYGRGYVQEDKAGGKVLGKKHVYYVADQNVWVEIRLSHVLEKNLERSVEAVVVTKRKLCDKKFTPKKSFGSLITGKGIKIGDALDKIIRAYGTPSVSIVLGEEKSFAVLREEFRLQKGRVLRYLPSQSNDLLFSEFYFADEALHSILISISE